VTDGRTRTAQHDRSTSCSSSSVSGRCQGRDPGQPTDGDEPADVFAAGDCLETYHRILGSTYLYLDDRAQAVGWRGRPPWAGTACCSRDG
jgi:hypothetical protein